MPCTEAIFDLGPHRCLSDPPVTPRAAGGAEQAPLHLGALCFTGIKPGLKKQGERGHLFLPTRDSSAFTPLLSG